MLLNKINTLLNSKGYNNLQQVSQTAYVSHVSFSFMTSLYFEKGWSEDDSSFLLRILREVDSL